MRKIYLLDLFDLFSNEKLMNELGMNNSKPKNDDENWTKTQQIMTDLMSYDLLVEEFEKDGFVTKKETWISTDGTSKYVRTYTESISKRKEDVKVLESQLKMAIEKEEYEKAAQLRDKIKELKK